jgi:hypothetical protein
MSNDRSPEEVIRGFYAIFNDETPELFDEYVAADYADYGHQAPGSPPQGVGPQGARANYDAPATRLSTRSASTAWPAAN